MTEPTSGELWRRLERITQLIDQITARDITVDVFHIYSEGIEKRLTDLVDDIKGLMIKVEQETNNRLASEDRQRDRNRNIIVGVCIALFSAILPIVIRAL